MSLTPDQLTQYHRDGYLILENFVTPAACGNLRERAGQLVRDFDPGEAISIFTTHEQSRVTDDYFLESGDKIRFFFEENAFQTDGSLRQEKEQSINKIGHALHDLDPVFDKFSRTVELKNLAEQLGIASPLLLQSMYIFKQPNIGGEVSCHQDATFIFTEPLSMAGLWFALEDATVENGCLWALPGGHDVGLKSRWIRTGGGEMSFDVFDSSEWEEERLVPLEVRKGTLIMLHPWLPHKSLENKSSRSRQAYTLHVISGTSNYPGDNWLQRPPDFPLRGFE
ncbi:MAG TPA: phytanoyl-CoA dioxygenase family protein [Pyrinomonadaceae bacterium]|jgi:phytanoyl-CoA hydroxylase|nr:phytanoyl-CoA dioxygenase family protein [Pyrinomonadaceae bacterium]